MKHTPNNPLTSVSFLQKQHLQLEIILTFEAMGDSFTFRSWKHPTQNSTQCCSDPIGWRRVWYLRGILEYVPVWTLYEVLCPQQSSEVELLLRIPSVLDLIQSKTLSSSCMLKDIGEIFNLPMPIFQLQFCKNYKISGLIVLK